MILQRRNAGREYPYQQVQESCGKTLYECEVKTYSETEKMRNEVKIDFHTHGKLAKKLPFSADYTDWLFREARRAGLDALCLTEHFNTLGFDEVYRYIEGRCTREGDSLVTEDGFRIFPGMEVDIAEGGHTLVTGPLECILEMNRRLEPNKAKGNFLPFDKWSEMVSEYPVLFGAGHPYREGGNIPSLPVEMLKRFMFLDINGKDLAEDCDGTWKKMRRLSKKLNRPLVAGSDTHQSPQYGCVYNVFEREAYTVEELFRQIQAGKYEIKMSDNLSFQVETAGILKRSLKEIHALGGDYVGVLLKGAEI